MGCTSSLSRPAPSSACEEENVPSWRVRKVRSSNSVSRKSSATSDTSLVTGEVTSQSSVASCVTIGSTTSEQLSDVIASLTTLPALDVRRSTSVESKVPCDLARMVTGMPGGVAIVALEGSSKTKLPYSTLDDGRLRQAFQLEVGVHGFLKKPERFEAILRAFCTPTATDRWERPIVENLALTLGYASLRDAPHLEALVQPEPQPKDGAIVVSLGGTVLGAAVLLRCSPQTGHGLRFMRRDGSRAGTRHAAALDTAQWLGDYAVNGVVVTKSDSGAVHFFEPQPQGSSLTFGTRPQVMEIAVPSSSIVKLRICGMRAPAREAAKSARCAKSNTRSRSPAARKMRKARSLPPHAVMCRL